ncbi:MAG: pyridoxine 5'-phosphate synthase [Desulfohalobiaceae bacterium]|nr:pyridoxine 5'-phosphate synthase [Desulfohalobiaceae bacterium]
MPKLVVNVDHIATIRQARLARVPDPVHAAFLAELGGAEGIIVHLREDRRHINDRDVELIRKTVQTNLHLEMAATQEMQSIALATEPHMVCLVPEKRQELTTEGGLNLVGQEERFKEFLEPIHARNIHSSLFIDAEPHQIQAAAEIGAEFIEIHTGHFADAHTENERGVQLQRILEGITTARGLGLKVNLGHGLNYTNIKAFDRIPDIREYSIGHSIVARASILGMEQAVRDMVDIIRTFAE